MHKEELEEEEIYLKRLEGGLFTLQLIDYILLEICSSGPSSIKQRVIQILNLRGGSLKAIRHIMRGIHIKVQFDILLISS